ncbi:MAG: NUDIX domain-containing protein [Chloroflexota bacterium]
MSEGADEPQRFCLRCGFVHYPVSYPTASALIVENGRLLLTQRRRDPFAGDWELPGGFLNAGEHPEQGVVREIAEELDVTVAVEALVGIFTDLYADAYADAFGLGKETLNLFYRCRIVNGRPVAQSEIAQFRWFAPDELPSNIAFRCNQQAVSCWVRSSLSKVQA